MKKIISFCTLTLVVSFTNAGAVSAGANATSTSIQGQQQAAVSDASNSGNTQNITFEAAPNDRGRAGDPEVINTNIDYSGSYRLQNVPAMAAPGLTTTLTETCMGSTSGAFAFSGFGLSGGTTWTDKECVRRLDAREIRAMGAVMAAKELMCTGEENYKAFKRAGMPCVFNPDFENNEKKEETAATSEEKNEDVVDVENYLLFSDGNG